MRPAWALASEFRDHRLTLLAFSLFDFVTPRLQCLLLLRHEGHLGSGI
jgi:hypothetical protein